MNSQIKQLYKIYVNYKVKTVYQSNIGNEIIFVYRWRDGHGYEWETKLDRG